MERSIPVVILAGGYGTRLREETEFRPKPMVPIGGKPILWHIMKTYAYHGFRNFIICLGYKGSVIKDYFLNYHFNDVDVTINTKDGSITKHHKHLDDWQITLAETGLDCLTGGRVARIAQYIKTDTFLLTYGDAVANVNISRLVSFHQQHEKLATLTGVIPPSRFGYLQLDNDQVTTFAEKQTLKSEWINGGFFVLNKKFISTYLSTQPSCILEQDPLRNAAQDQQLMVYKHGGFWQCMDTLREQAFLEKLWNTTAPWKVWQDPVKTFEPATSKPSIVQAQG
jgi:glucose-1-phosphate cytidylyltransferase